MFISQKITTLSEMKNRRFSIIDWELHQKLSPKRKIDTDYKYKRPKGNKKPGCFKRLASHIREVLKGLNDLRKNGHAPRN